MILLYHKIDVENKTHWWVSADTFYRQLAQLANKKVVYLDDYDPKNPDHVVITFDGVYDGVLRYAVPLLEQFGYPFELFVCGDHMGKGNEFDKPEPPARFADQKQLKQMVAAGGRLQWHTRTHPDLTKLSADQLESELNIPANIRQLDPSGFNWFSYPYGKFDKQVQTLVKSKFKGGISSANGSLGDKTIWPIDIVSEETQLIKEKVSVIIPSYNYGHFLIEAVESVLRQTYLPDEILLSDDASTDNTYEIMKIYAKKYPKLIKLNRNAENLGIEKHFNTAVSKTSGDFVCFLGADNRFGSNYIEECLKTLIKDKDRAIAYTDFALFGSRAEAIYKQFGSQDRGPKLEGGVYMINFPKWSERAKDNLLTKGNFIHGSSMYRRKAFDQVGGYKPRKGGPEDYALFQSMVKKGWKAGKAEATQLEYRQHSAEQANQQFSYFMELAFLRQHLKELDHTIAQERAQQESAVHELTTALTHATSELERLRNSRLMRAANKYWRLKHLARHPRTTLKKIKKRVSK
jgi:glycosyltransferase involved in cell wall biosynthesis